VTSASAILDLVDAHVHFFDLDNDHGLRWSWLEEHSGVGHVPDTSSIAARRFTPVELFAEGHRLVALSQCVHVQAATGTSDGLAETRWLQTLRDRHGAPHAAIAHVELDRDDHQQTLDAQAAYTWVRGVRDPGKTHLLRDAAYAQRVAKLVDRRLLFEVLCSARRYDDLAWLAERAPDTQIVLEHIGLAVPPSSPDFTHWRAELTALARVPNIWLKLSGLGLVDRAWSMDDATRLAEVALGAFGIERCVIGSNWPMDRVASSYPDAIHAITAGSLGLDPADRAALLSGNARALYDLPQPSEDRS
jgi:predicted TIM-barrel fold metal-dependent hydrolase